VNAPQERALARTSGLWFWFSVAAENDGRLPFYREEPHLYEAAWKDANDRVTIQWLELVAASNAQPSVGRATM